MVKELYRVSIPCKLSNTGETVKFGATSSMDLAKKLNNALIERPNISEIKYWDVKDYLTRPERTKQIATKFEGISLSRATI